MPPVARAVRPSDDPAARSAARPENPQSHGPGLERGLCRRPDRPDHNSLSSVRARAAAQTPLDGLVRLAQMAGEEGAHGWGAGGAAGGLSCPSRHLMGMVTTPSTGTPSRTAGFRRQLWEARRVASPKPKPTGLSWTTTQDESMPVVVTTHRMATSPSTSILCARSG
jgi:hypothetical protein